MTTTASTPETAAVSETRAPERQRRPRWELPALCALLVVTAFTYIWNLGASGWANAFYSAAVQAGAENWTAFLFGSSDAGNSITVDKPPAFLWLMALSVRVFGLNTWAMLIPQALLGVATTAVLYAAVRRVSTPVAALLAGVAFASTPIVALMFRYNNPDAMLVFLLTLTAYFVVRAVQDGRTRWMLWAGVAIGFAFLTKQLQAFVVLPGFAAAYLLAAPVPLRRRLRDGLLAVAAIIGSAGWWVALVELVPESWRPYVGGSQNDSFLELTFGYNGLGRITGNETGSVTPGGGGGQGSMWGSTGITRLLDGEIGGQASWLIPAAVILMVALPVLTWRRPRTDALRASVIVWGSWMLVTFLVFSFMSGIFHAYYTVALAPGIAGVIGLGAAELWRMRGESARRGRALTIVLAGTVMVTAVWAFVLLGRSESLLRWPVLVLGAASAIGLAASAWVPDSRKLAVRSAVAAVVVCLAGPTSYTVYTVQQGYTGSIITAGPAVQSGSMRGPGGGMGGGMGSGMGGGQGMPQPGAGAADGADSAPNAPGTSPDGSGTQPPSAGSAGGRTEGRMGGGLLGGTTVSDQITEMLRGDSTAFRWAAATTGSQNAASYQLAADVPVMPIGGFNGSDPFPTLQLFQQYVDDGEIHFYIAGGSMGAPNGGSSASSEIESWVQQNFTAQTVDGVTVYDLTQR
ncbi:phospholipid carrier-dependent glycosyltransferase [Pseudoclavibacter sp. CFCC 14310]|uniref:ArnT family glycosyltransferase n=1 Tax=Pseudoclavibacter sp. CFCC 14310 TaxID=2615180 RepID=UPI00130131F2|nr:glycosyltransferase family 39 protein [Pseudoclavibacter sp. CFCC 14310]KAB1646493.1 phospholipid carrier-dependent glycosyltransferase [Pseudoclavibacter sp. CFCC 14310]